MIRSARTLGLSGLLLASLLIVSCSDDDDGTTVFVPPIIDDPEFLVRAVHASPDAPTVDVSANGVLAFPGLNFFEVAPDANATYVPFPAGTVDVDVDLPGGGFVIGESFFFPEDTNQTVVVTGLLAPTGNEQPLQILSFPDDVTPSPGLAEIRILHLAPDAPAVDVRLGVNDPNGVPLVLGLPFGESSDNFGRIIVEPGTYDVTVFAAETDVNVFTTTLSVTADNNFTVYAVGELDNASFTLAVSVDH